jgi:hypothetical protein
MTNSAIIWKTLQERLPKHTWMPIAEVYAAVENYVQLDAEDLENVHPSSPRPRWKSNVRRLLRQKKESGTIRHRRSRQ